MKTTSLSATEFRRICIISIILQIVNGYNQVETEEQEAEQCGFQRENFFSIATMMFVLFFLFQFSMVLRDSKNTYDINSSLTEKKADGRNRWTPSDNVTGADSSVVFIRK